MKKVELDSGISFNVFTWNSRYPEIKKGTRIEKHELHQVTKNGNTYINLTDPEDGRPDDAKEVDMSGKDESIDKHMTRKEMSIRKASTIKMAHEIVKAKLEVGALENTTDRNIENQIMYWRNWYNDNWDKVEGNRRPEDIIDDNQ